MKETPSTLDRQTICKLRGRLIIKQELGTLRSYASQIAHEENIDEEELFLSLAQNWLDGISNEVSKIFGAEKASHFMDPFNHV